MTQQELSETAMSPLQYSLIEQALKSYDAPSMFFEDGNPRPEDWRDHIAQNIRTRLDARVREDGLAPMVVTIDDEEYRVIVEALNQYSTGTGFDEFITETIKTLKVFKNGGDM